QLGALRRRAARVARGDAVRDALRVVEGGGEALHPQPRRLLRRSARRAANALQVQRLLPAEPDEEDALGAQLALARVEDERLAVPALEVAAAHHLRDPPPQPLVHRPDGADEGVLPLEDLHREKGRLELRAIDL